MACEYCNNLDKWVNENGTPMATCKLDGHQVRTSIETCDDDTSKTGRRKEKTMLIRYFQIDKNWNRDDEQFIQGEEVEDYCERVLGIKYTPSDSNTCASIDVYMEPYFI